MAETLSWAAFIVASQNVTTCIFYPPLALRSSALPAVLRVLRALQLLLALKNISSAS